MNMNVYYSIRLDGFNDILDHDVFFNNRDFIHFVDKANNAISSNSMKNEVISLRSDYFFDSLFIFPINEDIRSTYFHDLVLIKP